MNWFQGEGLRKIRKPMVKGVRINKERLQELLKGRNYSAVGRALRLSSATIWHLARGEQDRVLRTTLAKLEGYLKEKLSSHWDYVEPKDKLVKIPIRGTVGTFEVRTGSDIKQLVTQAIEEHCKQISELEEKIKNLEAILQNL